MLLDIISDKQIIIYGAGQRGKLVGLLLEELSISYVFADKHAKEIDKKNVLTIEKALEKEDTFIVIAIADYTIVEDVHKELISLNVSLDRFLDYEELLHEIYNIDIVEKYYEETRIARVLENQRKIRSRCVEIDSLLEFEKFDSLIRSELDKSKPITDYSRFEESHYYGHLESFVDYANIKSANNIYISNLEHGVRFAEDVDDISDFSYEIITQGSYRNNKIRDKKGNVLISNIGPYIHYAKKIYSDDTLNELKRKYGSVALYFPRHGCESENIGFGGFDLDDIVQSYKHKYDTFLVCGYWYDLDSEYFDNLKRAGAIVVSAGARWDMNFISRLKAIIGLADVVIVDEIGTNIGYAIYMDKKIDVLPGYLNYISSQNEIFAKNTGEILGAIDSGNKKKIEDIYNKYWGGNLIKNKLQMQAIFENHRTIMKLTGFNPYRYYDKARCYLEYMEQSADNELYANNIEMLKLALGDSYC